MGELKLIIPGEPFAQGRPRFSTAGGFVRAYDPKESRNYKAFVKYIANEETMKQGWKYTTAPIEVSMKAFLKIPASKSKKFKKAAVEGIERPTKKPDIDNIFKAVTDALSGVAYADDKQIVKAVQSKWYAEEPRLEVEIKVVQ